MANPKGSEPNASASGREFLRAIAQSTADGIEWANSFLKVQRKAEPMFCVPDKLRLTGAQIVDAVRLQKTRPWITDGSPEKDGEWRGNYFIRRKADIGITGTARLIEQNIDVALHRTLVEGTRRRCAERR
jgi:hypothetical protein